MADEERNKILQDQFLPVLYTFGATQAMTVDTGDRTASIITVSPDQATRDAAMEKIAALREKGASTFSSEMTGEMKGEVVASA